MVSSADGALQDLRSASVSLRFRAARYFVKSKHPECKLALIERLKVERVRHIKMALRQAISSIDKVEEIKPVVATDYDFATEKALRRYLKAQAISEFSGTIIHELSKKIGLLEANLQKEFQDFSDSLSQKSLDNLKAVFKGIENLQRSVENPTTTEFDFSLLIEDIAYEEISDSDISVNFEGPRPCIVKSDRSILTLALSNGVRNSIESIVQVTNYSSLNNIVISWGINDHDVWVSIIDNGIGIFGDPKKAFKIGNTNKKGHIGFGLGILDQCMDTLGGLSELSNVSSGGAKLVLRWNKE
ncbi:sensor histidine kinase [Marinobacter sp. LV10MA510-1]|uniref:sensor histidine kinase n=1 Tax=Marinobacter sp. LV10MA510-1 TaxID=1415567 RepID=UPI000BF7AA50|nr:HAMP domain-containing sensor histidine kinase [Marinobacter sp. LV10MA510-1]PFG11528.1 signal transduction histidine kinase [Marinobacter sp. LV10MA510-1]